MPPKLPRKNRYWALRHGQSEANVDGLIISSPSNGLHAYGLTDTGREQIHTSLMNWQDGAPVILCSDFLRARQTAELAADILRATPPTIETGLRERFFGRWEGSRHGNYHLAWQQDRNNPYHDRYGVEPVMQVLNRMMAVVETAETTWQNRSILLVSHGDPLQILQTHFDQIPPGMHRSIPLIHPGELRHL